MKVIRVNFWRLFSCFSFVFNIIKNILGRGKGRKDSNEVSNSKQLPTSVSVQQNEQAELDDWEQWGKDEQFSIKVEPSTPPSDPTPSSGEVDLFQDMQPVFQKTKKIRVKKSVPNNVQELGHPAVTSSRLNFDMRYTAPETELGTWLEEPSAWDEGVSEREIELETENVFKEKKKAERERRMLEQLRKKEEKEMIRAARKSASGLGVKVA